jgi:hypothetical protein
VHTVIVRLEALSQAVMSTFEFLPRVEDASGRRTLEHACGLMVVLDEEIAKAVAAGDSMVRQLGELRPHPSTVVCPRRYPISPRSP